MSTNKKYGKKSKKRTTKRNYKKKRSTNIATPGSTWVMNKSVSKEYKFVRGDIVYNNISGAGALVQAIETYSPTLLLPFLSDYTNLFGKVKIDKVVWRWDLRNSGTSASYTNIQFPKMYIRYNDNKNLIGGIATINGLEQMENVKVHQFSAEHPSVSYTMYPKVLKPLYVSGTEPNATMGYGSTPCPWLDIDDGITKTLSILGLMYVIDYLPTGYFIQQDCTVYFRCRELD